MDNSHRGTKRKRYEPPTEDLQVKITRKMHHDVKEVRKAAKKAKTFETQKLVKKLKGTRGSDRKSQEIAELEAQLDSLKPISHEVIADTVLKSRLNKDRILSQNEHVRMAASSELVSTLLPAVPGTPRAKCESRLLSSKILAAVVSVVVEDLRNLLQPRNTENDSRMISKATNVTSQTMLKQVTQDHEVLQGADLQSKRGENRLEQVKKAFPTGELGADYDKEEVDDAGWESGTVDDIEKSVDDGWESGSLTDSNSEDGAEELAAPSIKQVTKNNIRAKVSSPTGMSRSTTQQSTFLPSLSVGFVRGTSDDSDLGETEAAGDIDFKKNRRGQRARRAIWEKKYGRNANHKKKEFERRGASTAGKDHRHGSATSIQHRDAPSRRQTGGDTGTQAQYGVNYHARTVKPSHLHHTQTPVQAGREERLLHPSWEAKRKLKEKESASIVPSLGKKIKF